MKKNKVINKKNIAQKDKAIKNNNMIKIDSEKLEEMFTNAFRETIEASAGNVVMDEIECIAEKDFVANIVAMKITVYGLAGTTTKLGFYNKETGKIAKGFEKIQFENCSFKFDKSFDLNTNDYALMYVSE